MQIQQKLKGTLSSVFNTLSGEKGFGAALAGYSAVGCISVALGMAVAASPFSAGIALLAAAGSVKSSSNFAKLHDRRSSSADPLPPISMRC